MKNIFFALLFFASSAFAQTQMAVFIPGQGWVYKTFPDSTAVAQALAARPTLAGVTLPTTGTLEALAVSATAATTGTMTTTMTSAMQTVFTITPTGACTFNASGGTAGQRMTFIVTTSGTSAFVLTWSTNYITTGTLSTGIVSAKHFCINFICINGTTWIESGRTAAE